MLLLCLGLVIALAETIIGIDLGTTYSCVAVSRAGQVEIIPNELGARVTPSYVAFTADGERLVGEAAKNYAPVSPENTIFDVKRLIGRKFDDPEVQKDMKLLPYKIVNRDGRPFIQLSSQNLPDDLKGKVMSPEEISAMVLMKMKALAEDYLGERVSKAVITVPAYFSDSQRSATKDAGRIAGLDVVRIINEPTSSSIAYGLDKKSQEAGSNAKNILVFDCGGGTHDVSILSVDSGVFEVLATSGDTHLGGEDFDRRLLDHFLAIFKKKHGIDLSVSRSGDSTRDIAIKKAVSRLRRELEAAKRQLSTAATVRVEVDSLIDGIDFSESLSRAKFEELNIDLFKKSIKPVEQVLHDAKLKTSDIDEVVLVGGSTRIPRIRQLLSDYFHGKELNKDINADEAVAWGAAVQASILSGAKDHDVLLIDVTPLTLGIETQGGIMTPLIERNSYIPVKKSKVFSTVQDQQTMVKIQVYEGERSMVKDNNLLGNFDLNDIPPAPRGVPQIEVTFEIDSNGILTVSAVEKSSAKEESITIKNDRGRLSEDEINRLVREAEEFAEEDRLSRERAEARNSLEAVVSITAAQVDADKEGNLLEKLSKADVEKVREALKEAQDWMITNSDAGKEEIDEARERFEKVVQPILAEHFGHASEGGSSPEYDFTDKDEL
ncbi:Bip [Giardia muris]|uniref:Bip n=1 Tax=Giardia muris TaxID=5742 RepID=A0A4Z1SN39_GIAMU|nr:Bip [Giardia muris]|eukprot:TNJ27152.1 Bip [Giardia muris]